MLSCISTKSRRLKNHETAKRAGFNNLFWTPSKANTRVARWVKPISNSYCGKIEHYPKNPSKNVFELGKREQRSSVGCYSSFSGSVWNSSPRNISRKIIFSRKSSIDISFISAILYSVNSDCGVQKNTNVRNTPVPPAP